MTDLTPGTQPRVVITGLGIRCALGDGTEQVWSAVRAGTAGIRVTQHLDVSSLTCHYSGELDDPGSPIRRPRGRLDRATRLALSATTEAIEQSGIALDGMDPYRVGLAIGTSVGGLSEGEQFHWELLEQGPDATRRHHLLIYPLYSSADAISVAFGIKGPKVVISNACAAGANSIGYAADTIRSGRADVMLAGGVDVLDLLSLAGFDSLKAVDQQPCSPYSRSSGVTIGEGAAILVLETEDHALTRGAVPLAHFLGYALTSDAHHATAPDPAGAGAFRAMRRVLEQTGLSPADIDYVNGHGTGTPANDSAEQAAIDTLFADTPDAAPPISSTKSQVGHTLGAAGAIEAAVCTLALRDQQLPPTINQDPAKPPTRDVVPASRPHPTNVVLSNSFAFGGNNCTLALGRRPAEPPRPMQRQRVVITGAGVVSPLGTGRAPFMEALRSGATAVGPARELDTSLSTTKLAAEIIGRDHRRFVDPAYARRMDQLGLLVMAASRSALVDADLTITRADSERTGMIFGTCTGPLETVSKLTDTIGRSGPDRVNPRLFPNSVMNAAAGHACLALQIKGPLSTVATGCVAGLTALGYAADLVATGEADVVLAVSADELTPLLHYGYDRLGVLSSSAARPYDVGRDGCVLGTAGVALVVESLEHAQARGATPLGEMVGQAITSDAFRIAGNDPSGTAWQESMRRSLVGSPYGVEDVVAVYGDARGTAVIDIAEARAVSRIWKPGQVALANISGQVGHVHGTTPMLSMVSALDTIDSGWAPGVEGLRDPLPEIADHVQTGGLGRPGPCVVTAANWGGTYASVVVGPVTA